MNGHHCRVELIGKGRDADVYALDGGRVLRRYRHGGPTRREAELMGYLAERGYPVPKVYECTDDEMVMERVDGPTMLTMIQRRPLNAGAYARQLAELHNRLHEIAAPEWLERHASGGDRMIHLDLHPDNIILSANGPVVIDWRNARAGAPGADIADIQVIFKVFRPPVPWYARAPLSAASGLFVRDFLRAANDAPGPHLATIIAGRLATPTLLPKERAKLEAWAARLAA